MVIQSRLEQEHNSGRWQSFTVQDTGGGVTNSLYVWARTARTSARDMRQQRRGVSALALQRNEWSGATIPVPTVIASLITNVMFDVYAVDFGEEGGTWHGDLILELGIFVG
jgi:hypothetical protein